MNDTWRRWNDDRPSLGAYVIVIIVAVVAATGVAVFGPYFVAGGFALVSLMFGLGS